MRLLLQKFLKDSKRIATTHGFHNVPYGVCRVFLADEIAKRTTLGLLHVEGQRGEAKRAIKKRFRLG